MRIPVDRIQLQGELEMPAGAPRGLVIFAHGSGSSRLSPRNQYVARALREVGVATLLFDLLTEDEALDRENVFDIELLAGRLLGATAFARRRAPGLAIGYFGASTGAAAALIAAARDHTIAAVVSRGGRPDLAGPALRGVKAPTLLIVGGDDEPVIKLNRLALVRLPCEKELVIVPGATHLFEEPGTLDEVVRLASAWFARHLESHASVAHESRNVR
jgi:putative phosphoribosyl transferase